MKDSTFLLMISAMVVTVQAINPSDATLIAGFITISSMYICRAIEKNGKEK